MLYTQAGLERVKADLKRLFDPDKEAEAKKADPVTICGKNFTNYLRPRIGRFKQQPIMCHQWHNRECRVCFNLRMQEVRGRVKNAAKMSRLHVISLAKAKSIGLMKKMAKDEYFRVPILEKYWNTYNEGLLFFDVEACDECIGTRVDADVIKGLDWTILADTPVGKRTSGTLGAKEELVVSIKDAVEIETVNIISSEISEQDLIEAEKASIRATMFLNPKTEDELKEAVRIRATVHCEQIEAFGGKVIGRHYVKAMVDPSTLIWDEEYSELISQPLTKELKDDLRAEYYRNHKQ